MTLDFLVTRRTLTLGIQDTTTGWYKKEFAETEDYDKMVIVPKGQSATIGKLGFYARYHNLGLIAAPLEEDDEIIDKNGVYYRILSVQEVLLADSHICYQCEMDESPFHGDVPLTSGTWHVDTYPLKTDPRERTKTILSAYLNSPNDYQNGILEDDGVTLASWIMQFANPDYNLKRVFLTKNVDVIFTVDKTTAKPKEDYLHKIYAFEEEVPVTISAINKTGITATRLVEETEQVLRDIITQNYLGSLREIKTIDHESVDLGGGVMMWSTTVTVKYTRANDDYVPSAPKFDDGVGFIYEGDRTAGGPEGTWTLTVGGGSTCTQAVNSENNLVLNQTVFGADSYTTNGTSLALSSAIYGRIRIRYKTTGSATAKVIVQEGANTQTVLAATSSTSWTVVDVALTIDHVDVIHLYICAAIGTVTYDFVEIYKRSYILPNCIEISPPIIVEDAVIPIFGRSGSINQTGGTQSVEVTMKCDLDMEHSNLTWKRPQTTTATDYNNIDMLLETAHLTGSGTALGTAFGNTKWVWLDLGDPTMQFKARLIKVAPAYSESGKQVELTWREYRHGTAGSETTVERFGLNL